jgi:hypothetical protein
MEIEDRIRTRIEAILVNDARNFNEIKKMAVDDEPLEADDILADERNLYHRIINSYRNAVSEVNKLLEESIGSLSGFYHIVESIKEKQDFQEICSQIVNCMLQDFGADYCGILFRGGEETLCLEGICEDRKLLRIHSKESLLGSKEFELELTRMAVEGADCLNIEDVYREPRFNAVDFPGVVRSVLCLPILLHNAPVGFLVLSHSLPNFFKDNHVRVLKIIGSFVAHLKLLHQNGRLLNPMALHRPSDQDSYEKPDAFAVALLEFDTLDAYGRRVHLDKKSVREIRRRIQSALDEKESILFYGDRELLVFMPGISTELLAARVRGLRESFEFWQRDRFEERRNVRINLGFSVCEGDEDLARTLEVASLVTHPDTEEESEA